MQVPVLNQDPDHVLDQDHVPNRGRRGQTLAHLWDQDPDQDQIDVNIFPYSICHPIFTL